MSTSSKPKSRRSRDAISVLKADHREVKGQFAQFKKASDPSRKAALARDICGALRVHTTIEEQLFYPAFLEATKHRELHHEAEIEHHAAKYLIAEIEQLTSADDYFSARVNVLGEMVKQHILEEEKPGGMFAEARKAKMDLLTLGRQLAERKSELEARQKAA
jgi:hypothetical protein